MTDKPTAHRWFSTRRPGFHDARFALFGSIVMRIRVAPASSQTQFFKKVSLVLQATVLHPRIASSSQNSVGLARHSQKVYWKMYAPQREISNYAAGRKEGMGQWVSLDKKANSKFVEYLFNSSSVYRKTASASTEQGIDGRVGRHHSFRRTRLITIIV
jgi:hypothetical protein